MGAPLDPVSIGLTVGGLALFAAAWWAYHRRRVIADTATSKVRSMAIGQVELKGAATVPPGASLERGPFTDELCVYWEYTVEEKRTRRTKNGTQTYWASLASGRSKEPIALCDDTGVAVVDPQDADLPTAAKTLYGSSWGRDPPPRVLAFLQRGGISHEGLFGANKTMRYTERRLPEGTPIFVLGNAVRREDATGPGNAALVVQREGPGTFLVETGSEESILLRWTLLFWGLLVAGIGLAGVGAYMGVR